ncbi:hypothetical protein [Nocardia lijiangensis]|uniref:hypothetical protein n=1 Tax=Nocardia lijiangensis TaxID=299618 RepID=UPI003D7554C3
MQYYTDVAVPLEGPLRSAAEFALEMEVEHLRTVSQQDWREIRTKLRSRLAPEVFDATFTPVIYPETGGLTFRAIDAKAVGEGVVKVTMCQYNVPGVWTLKDGQILTPGLPRPGGLEQYLLFYQTVVWTDGPAMDGSVPPGPRWLQAISPTKPQADQKAVCEPFRPEPYVQKMPDPTTPTSTPTR